MFQPANYVTFLAAGEDFSGMSLNLNFDFSGILSIAAYVFLALGMYAIAKRRGISKPWLAWVPFGQTWMLGCISDQYQYVVMGQRKSKRKVMLTLEIITAILAIIMVCMIFSMLFGIIAQLDWDQAMQDPGAVEGMIEQIMENNMEVVFGTLGGIILMVLPLMAVAIWLSVLQFMACYDIFASCDPKNKKLFTALGIVLSFFGLSVLLAIFVFICRNKDEGMPPRKPEVEPQQPMAADPVFAPVVDAPAAPEAEVFSDNQQ